MADHDITAPGLPRWHPDPRVRETITRIRRFGWVVNAVSDICEDCEAAGEMPDRTFAYTVGLTLDGSPELAVYGLTCASAYAVLSEMVDLLAVEDWKQLVEDCEEITLDALDAPVRLIEMVDTLDLIHARAVFPDVPALQVVWADEKLLFPWDEGYTLLPEQQQIHGIPDTASSHRAAGPRVIRSAGGPNRAARRARKRRRR
ncbi:DUF4262 domain-containing protein [Williamsia deligens]|uniref:DUF4262 domain-containing protein n=1 Tax=Williamsia deligens TaxID=321325 RepID=A0ABW3G2X9_9NOCA|nr:DUF4262 domain-containing protein [Williamsia deligens]MCP2194754.1 protein of unknown function (DUF4262) [Williamsia deligens]